MILEDTVSWQKRTSLQDVMDVKLCSLKLSKQPITLYDIVGIWRADEISMQSQCSIHLAYKVPTNDACDDIYFPSKKSIGVSAVEEEPLICPS